MTIPSIPTQQEPHAHGSVALSTPNSTGGLLSNGLQLWLAEKGATEVFEQYQQLAREVFPQDSKFAFSLESDPDSGEESVICVATLSSGYPVTALSYYNQFVAKWARRPDPQHSGLFTLLVR